MKSKRSSISILILIKIFLLQVNADLPYCEPCKEGFTKLADFFVEEENLDRQVQVLSAFICNDGDEACVTDIKTWWPGMARALMAQDSTIPTICGDIGVCPPIRSKYLRRQAEITCEVCNTGIESFAMVLKSEKNILRTIDLLTGDAFCTEPSSHYGIECIGFVQMFTPQAMPIMSQLILDEQPILCGEVLNYCPDI